MRRLEYVIVSPVKDEGAYITFTLESMITQTRPPQRWLLVDDGSRDDTPAILEHYRQAYAWIDVLRLERDAQRRTGSAEIIAFSRGVERLAGLRFDVIVKLDGDLRFSPTYFDGLLRRFEADGQLGIASGVYLEARRTRWVPVPMPPYHAAGACKAVRWQCFREIGGFVPVKGWDTVDEIRAQMRGWRTGH